MKLALLFFASTFAFAQNGTPVRLVDDPPPDAVTFVYVISANKVTAICSARANVTTGLRAATQISISAATNANPVVFTSTAHGLDPSLTMNSTTATVRPKVTISGATTGWTGVNGTFTATVIDANTFSIPVDSTAFGALSGTLVFTTTAPRVAMPEWSVQRIFYDANGNAYAKLWLGGAAAYSSKCSDAATTTLQQQ